MRQHQSHKTKKKYDQAQKHAVQIIVNVNKETHEKQLFQELNALSIYQINLSQVLKFMQKFKASTSPRVFSTYFQPINHVYEIRFSRHSFKQPDGFSKYINILMTSRPKGFRITPPRQKKISSILSFLTHFSPMLHFYTPLIKKGRTKDKRKVFCQTKIS